MGINKFYSKLDLTFILSILIGISYFFTYIYEVIYFWYFNIPFSFLSIGVKDVVFTISVITFFLIYIFSLLIVLLLLDKIVINNVNVFSFFKISEIRKKKEKLKLVEQDYNETKRKIYEDSDKHDKLIKDTEVFLVKNDNSSEDNKAIIESLDKLKKNRKSNRENMDRFESKLKSTYKEFRNSYINKFISFSMFFIIVLLLIFTYFTDNYILFIIVLFAGLFTFWSISKLINKDKMILLFTLILVSFTFFVASTSFLITSQKEDYIIFKEKNKNNVVLTIYEDQFLYVNIDRKTNKIDNKYNLIPVNEVDGFKKEKIGLINIY